MSQRRASSSAHQSDQPAESGNADTAQVDQDATATTAEHYERATAALQALVDEYSRTRAELADSGAQ